MIQGLRTVIYPTSDLAEAKRWYSRAFEREPYFDQPFYVGFEIGGFELGLIPDGQPGPQGAVAYWGVADAAAEVERLISLGATLREPLQEVGGGIKVASVADPFGSTIGIIENPNFDSKKVQ